MGRILQRLYDICGAIAGGLTLCICLLVSAQILLNAAGRLGFDQLHCEAAPLQGKRERCTDQTAADDDKRRFHA